MSEDRAVALTTTTTATVTAPATDAANVENGLQNNCHKYKATTDGNARTGREMQNDGSSATNTITTADGGGDSGGAGVAVGAVGAGGHSVKLPESVLHKLYHSYSIKQRRAALKWFFVAAILFNIWSLVIPQEQGVAAIVVTVVVLSVNLLFVILIHLNKFFNSSSTLQKSFEFFLSYAPHVLWIFCISHLVLYILLQETISPRDVLGWAILLNFLIYVTLPIPLFYAGSIIGVATFLLYVLAVVVGSRRDPLFSEQVLANVVLILTAAAIGLLYYFMGEAKQKRAFLEAKQSLEVKMIIEEQSAEQERLLLSVLPKHVAVKMRQDLGSTSSEPFKKIYMSRHENVSILYADIVGFTAISSTYSAQDLVKMLNELFARFDRLSEKYQQLRIKILGDCYYCISGAPDERPDHAVLCVHMGLSMVKAIKYVQQKANSPVDMRVGIHTGAVLAGILGQRQWQFDVYSKDVELANKMESSGKAGRVHISDKTLAFLNGEFEVEPAHGERREEALRIAGLKTYFIVKVLKPFASPGAKKINETQNNEIDNDQDQLEEELLAEKNGETKKSAKEIEAGEALDKQAIYKERLQEELVARDGHENLSKDTSILLKFKNKNLEAAYASYREPYSSVPLIAALLVQFVDIIYSYIVLPRCPLHFVNISAPLIPIAMLVFISIAESFPRHIPEFFVNISKRFNDITLVRELAAIFIAVIVGVSNVVDMYFFVTYPRVTDHVVSETEFNFTTEAEPNASSVASVFNTPSPVSMLKTDEVVIYPSYLSHFGVLILISIAVIAQLTHMTKIVLMAIIAALHCYYNVYVTSDLYVLEDNLAGNPAIPTRVCTSGLLVLAALALSFFARHMDREDRVIFKWKTEVAEQKEMATDMRQRNEALVYNVLPVHVAEHFMKNTKRSHDDLYSQSYAEVGVLFASMPNFSDFYSEETVNNQGLECLRFLNEVISDFDALLELPQFQDIIKIKTIGSTYMAASGINLNRVSLPDDPITKRWAHLDVLVEFALELKNALQGINEQSFNHFVLKMGINHGPITAGVIGARKPHYDIWGNTVNVASRMESTGKAGAIQVTEETCNILQEFGYTFQQRGLVSVKGKGQLMTYYLQGKSEPKGSMRQAQIRVNKLSNENLSKFELSPQSSKRYEVTENGSTVPSQTNGHNINGHLPESHHRGGNSNRDDPEVDIKTPLLDLKSQTDTSNPNSLDGKAIVSSDNEKDSLIKH